jgi:hypothetical protein
MLAVELLVCANLLSQFEVFDINNLLPEDNSEINSAFFASKDYLSFIMYIGLAVGILLGQLIKSYLIPVTKQ